MALKSNILKSQKNQEKQKNILKLKNDYKRSEIFSLIAGHNSLGCSAFGSTHRKLGNYIICPKRILVAQFLTSEDTLLIPCNHLISTCLLCIFKHSLNGLKIYGKSQAAKEFSCSGRGEAITSILAKKRRNNFISCSTYFCCKNTERNELLHSSYTTRKMFMVIVA